MGLFDSLFGKSADLSNPALQSLNQYAQNNPNQQMIGAGTGSQFATEQVQKNPILGQLFGQQGLMGQEIGKEQELQKQGFNLTPEDKTMYGQMSGDIARQFGQQSEKAAQNLASRGLSSSGAAGAAFSGLAGNQNEMLAQAQQQIAQQRFQNTMKQIGQQQQFIGQLGGQAGQAINQQFGRQLAGAQEQRAGLESAAGLQQKQGQLEQQAAGPGLLGTIGGALTGGLGSLAGGIGTGLAGGLFSPSKTKQPTDGLPGLQGGMPLSGGNF